MTREEFEKMVRSLDGDALEVLDGEANGFGLNSPFDPGSAEVGLDPMGLDPVELGLNEDASEEEIEEALMNNCFYNFEVEVDGSAGKVGVIGTFAVVDGYVERIERLQAYDMKGLPDGADASDGVQISEDSHEMSIVYDRLAELLKGE